MIFSFIDQSDHLATSHVPTQLMVTPGTDLAKTNQNSEASLLMNISEKPNYVFIGNPTHLLGFPWRYYYYFPGRCLFIPLVERGLARHREYPCSGPLGEASLRSISSMNHGRNSVVLRFTTGAIFTSMIGRGNWGFRPTKDNRCR